MVLIHVFNHSNFRYEVLKFSCCCFVFVVIGFFGVIFFFCLVFFCFCFFVCVCVGGVHPI